MSVLVVDHANRVLLQVRSKHWAGRFRGLLELPQGHLDPGESLQACAARELEEETGLTGFTPRQEPRESTVLDESLGELTTFVVAERGEQHYLAVCIVGQATGVPRASAESSEPTWYERAEVIELLAAQRIFPLNVPMLRWHYGLD